MTTMYAARQHLNEVKEAHSSHVVVDAKGHHDTLCRVCSTPWPCDDLKAALRMASTAVDLPTPPPVVVTPTEVAEFDDEYRARARMVAGDWFDGDPEFEKFVGILMECRRGPEMTISSNDVRARYLEDTVNGPRIRIKPNQFSAFWGRARQEGFVAIQKNDDGTEVLERITNSPTGNNGKWIPVRVWTGGPTLTRPGGGQLSAASSGA